MSDFRVGCIALPDLQGLPELVIVLRGFRPPFHHQITVDFISGTEREAASAGTTTLAAELRTDSRVEDNFQADDPLVAGVIARTATDTELPVDHIFQGFDFSQ